MKNSFKKSMVLLFIAMMGFTMINCPGKKSEDSSTLLGLLAIASSSSVAGSDLCDGVGVPNPTQVLEGNINGAVTVSGSALLRGTVNVTGGGSITILPKSVIFAERGSSLFIYENGRLTAQGTAAQPICFTSANSVGQRAPGDWGGIVVVGNGTSTRTSTTEGTTPKTYPGTQDGIINLSYVIIEFVGNEVAPGNELNGVSSYAVKSSTSSYDHVQIHRGLDDGFEWWGGNVGGQYLLVTGGMDDDFDMDEGFSGSLSYIIGVKYPNSCGGTVSTDPHGFEMDGSDTNGSGGTGLTNPNVSNFTTLGQSITAGEGMRFREGMRGTFTNGLVYGYLATNINCINNGGTAGNTNPTGSNTNIKVQSGKNVTLGAQCVALTASAELTSIPIVDAGNIADCGIGGTKPDFTSTAAYATLGGGPVAQGKWWDGWTVYRAR
ncbi:hypothetical protein EHQ96_06240 [Leptospira levettii]|uniref:hypothetical protein n=1 Tax=Leptospira levettii TaxID=2023178 RepID=UPI001083844F|nr:hypothetical protein [Leptospira levettii]TGL02960.1 hypothetical protein EHQ39_18205 [Leptospira levettii]TGM69140.1 hypothetical protein EHQ96_06240 [Leptospira levettii]TGM75974.1 hypothetical protein EHR04_10480 [Leptospira levettii]